MPPKPKKRGVKSIINDFGSLFSSSKGRRRDERAEIAHDLPVGEELGHAHTPPPIEEPEASIVSGPAIRATTATEHLLSSYSNVGSSTSASAHSSSSPVEHTTSTSMFANAQKFNVENINIGSSQYVHIFEGKRIDGWKMLLKNMASNALHDSRARFDPPKCDEDTRVEVTNELMDWIQDRDAPQRLLCMTGAAGAGKSALQQTISERCSGSNILGSAFFFSTGDPTRNDLTHIVPTIACQLGLHNAVLQNAIAKAVEKDPLIFDKTVKTQMDTLVVAPFQRVCASGQLDRNTFPHAILIDGLDECSGEENQAELLSTIKHCLLDNDLPFRIFLACRPELAIRSALDSEPEGYLYQLAYHIKLSDDYDATADIRRYLWRRLRDIGSRCRDRRARSHLWPTEDIEKLVAAASGQFIYAATVIKYVSEPRSFPVDRLQTVVNWTPEDGQQTRPFEQLDILYRNILSTAKELYEAVDTNQGRDFLVLFRAHHANIFRLYKTSRSLTFDFDEIIGIGEGGCEILCSDLHSLVFFENWRGHGRQLRFYHRSFSEFLDSEFRAQHLFVSETRVRKYVTESCLQKILEPEKFLNGSSGYKIFRALSVYSGHQTQYLDVLRLMAFTRNNGWERIDRVLSSDFRREDEAEVSHFRHRLGHFTFRVIQRLNDETDEPGLAEIVRSYFDKWEGLYEKLGFSIAESEYQVFVPDVADEQNQDWDEEFEVSASSDPS